MNFFQKTSASISNLFKKVKTEVGDFFAPREEKLIKAIKHGDEKKVKALLQESDGNKKDKEGTPFLHIAAIKDNENIVRLLIEKGKANVNGLNKVGESALYSTCYSKNKNIAKLLIEKGADVNILNESGISPLHRAIMVKNENVAKFIIEAPNLNIELINQKNKLLYECAVKSQNSTAKLLVQKGLNLDTVIEENLSARELFALNDDAKSFLKETGNFKSDADIESFIKFSKSKAISNLSYSTDDFGVTSFFADKIIRSSISDFNFPKKNVILETLEEINNSNPKKKAINLPNGNHLFIEEIPYKGHAAYALIEYDKKDKPLKITYCDGNSIADVNKNGYGYGGLSFDIDQKKIGSFLDKDGWKKYLTTAFNCESKEMYKNNRENFYKTLSKIVVCDKQNHPIITEKTIPTKPQKRGNCTLKSRNVVIREILRRTDPEMAFDEIDGKPSGKGYEVYKNYKKILTNIPVNNLLELAAPDHKEDFAYASVIDILKNKIFIQAAAKGDIKLLEKVKEILDREKINMSEIKNNEGDTAIFFAAKNKKVEAVEWLINSKAANIDEKHFGITMLIRCAGMENNLQVAELLLKKGCDAKAIEDHGGNTALHQAIIKKDLEMANLLMKYDAANDIKNKDGLTPELLARQNGYTDLANQISQKLEVKIIPSNSVVAKEGAVNIVQQENLGIARTA